MATPHITAQTDIAALICSHANTLNQEHEVLRHYYEGELRVFHLDLCADNLRASATAVDAKRAIMSRASFQKVLLARKQPLPSKSSSVIDRIFILRKFTTLPKFPFSLFHDGKAVISHDILLSILSIIWKYVLVAGKDFRTVVTAHCAYIPSHIISRFLNIVQPPRIRTPKVVGKAGIGRSSFGPSVLGESYLRVMTPNLNSDPPSNVPSLAAPRLTSNNMPVSPSVPASLVSVSPHDATDLATASPSTRTQANAPLRTVKARFAFLEETVSKTFPSPLPPANHHKRSLQFSSTRSIDKENVGLADATDSSGHNIKKRSHVFDQAGSSKRRKVDDGTSISAPITDEQLTVAVQAKEYGQLIERVMPKKAASSGSA